MATLSIPKKKTTTDKDYSMGKARKQVSELVKGTFSPKSTAGTLRDRKLEIEKKLKQAGA
jgi:hypothetical protein